MRKKIFSIWSILLVLVISIAVVIPGCGGDGATYDLTMAVSPAGSGTATDVTGTSPYASGTSVDIQAAAAAGYTFVEWTAPAGTFADPNAATTRFTMPSQNVTVTAHFVGPLDHFKCYDVVDASPLAEDVILSDQFGTIHATVGQAVLFANPTDKVYGEEETLTANPDHHFTFYEIDYEEDPGTWYVEVSNQFDPYDGEQAQYLTVWGPVLLAVPSQKVEPGNHEEPLSLDHFLVYQVLSGPGLDLTVDLKDQFGTDEGVAVGQVAYFANPVKKTVGSIVTDIEHPDDHLAFYYIYNTEVSYQQVQVINQLNAQAQNLYMGYPAGLLGVPSEKKDWGAQIDHFKCYALLPGPSISELVDLDDQFVSVSGANVTQASWFCNPAEKVFEPPPTPILNPDHHLTIYMLTDVATEGWNVMIQNQFGPQELLVTGPVALAVPTQKLVPVDHDPPVGLDHYLLYDVVGGTALQQVVGLTDEFGTEPGSVTVMEPYLFAIPVQKTHGADVTPVTNSMAHLVFYKIIGGTVSYPMVQVVNQFDVEPFYYDVLSPDMLAVPSLKVYYEMIQP